MRIALIFLYLFTVSGPVMANEAVFSGGCFWCMEHPFDELEGVSNVQVGYTGGQQDNPSYKQVSHGGTGHKESIKITYDPSVISYKTLLSVFWHNIDPFDPDGQFCDKGDQYQSAIFAGNKTEEAQAQDSKTMLEKKFKRNIATEILPAASFYLAEEYHQDYYIKNPWRYKHYRKGCGRDKRLKEIWDYTQIPEYP